LDDSKKSLLLMRNFSLDFKSGFLGSF